MNQDKRHTKKNLRMSGISALIFTLFLLGIYVMLRIGIFKNASYTLEVCLFLGMFVLFMVSILCWYMYLESYLYLQLYALGAGDDSENGFLVFIKVVGVIISVIFAGNSVIEVMRLENLLWRYIKNPSEIIAICIVNLLIWLTCLIGSVIQVVKPMSQRRGKLRIRIGIICVSIMLTGAFFSGRYAKRQMDDAYFWKRLIESTEEY